MAKCDDCKKEVTAEGRDWVISSIPNPSEERRIGLYCTTCHEQRYALFHKWLETPEAA